jgi:hypothetical protein
LRLPWLAGGQMSPPSPRRGHRRRRRPAPGRNLRAVADAWTPTRARRVSPSSRTQGAC